MKFFCLLNISKERKRVLLLFESPSAEDRDRDTAGEKKGIGIGFGTVHTG